MNFSYLFICIHSRAPGAAWERASTVDALLTHLFLVRITIPQRQHSCNDTFWTIWIPLPFSTGFQHLYSLRIIFTTLSSLESNHGAGDIVSMCRSNDPHLNNRRRKSNSIRFLARPESPGFRKYERSSPDTHERQLPCPFPIRRASTHESDHYC